MDNSRPNFTRQIIFVIFGGAFGGIVIFFFWEWLATNSIQIAVQNLISKSWRVPIIGIIYSISFFVIAAMPVVFLRRASFQFSARTKLILTILVSAIGGSLALIVAMIAANPFLPNNFSWENFFPLVLIDGILAIFVMLFLSYSAQLQAEKLQAELREQQILEANTQAQIQVLQAQINPHFLFNTLNTLSALVTIDANLARETINKLAEMFRYTFAFSQQEKVPLKAEISLTENYLQIEKVRFREHFDYKISLAENLNEVLIPPLILQPIAENAIKHGISGLINSGKVEINISNLGEKNFQIEVWNDTENEVEMKDFFVAGHSLVNIKKRLKFIYGKDFTLDFRHQNGRFYVILTLPNELKN